MKHILPIVALCCTVLPSLVQARIWTDARDTTRQFEGDLLAANSPLVTIKLANEKSVTLPESSFSAGDLAFIKAPETAAHLKAMAEANDLKAKLAAVPVLADAKAEEKPAAKEPAKAAEVTKPAATATKVNEALQGHLVKLDGKELKPFKHEVGKEPKFYLIYFSAKW